MENTTLKGRVRANKKDVSSNIRHAEQPVNVIFRPKSCSVPRFTRTAGPSSPPPLPADLTSSQSLPKSKKSLPLHVFICKSVSLHMPIFQLAALYPPTNPLPQALPFIWHCCLETGTYSLLFMVHSVSLTACPPLA